jgi:hypothetical protein
MGHRLTNIAATTAAVTNRIVTSTNMIVGDYNIANASPVWQGGAIITVTHSQVGGVTDTLGTIAVTGVDLAGQTQTDIITPVSAQTVNGTIPFRTVTKVTGAGWARNAGAGSEDTIVVGVAAGSIPVSGNGTLYGVLVNNTVAATVTISDAAKTIMTIPASQAAGTFYNFGDGVDFGGYLKVATTNTNDVTLIHSGSMPTTYAMS